MKKWPPKDPSDKLDYSLTWSFDPTSDTIAASVWDVTPATITIDAQSKTTSATTLQLSGGVAGTLYKFTNTVTTSTGRIYERSVSLQVANL